MFHLIALGTRMPTWIQQGFEEYAKRLPPDYRLSLTEIPLNKRTNPHHQAQVLRQESEAMLKQIDVHPHTHIIALDERGSAWSTEQLAKNMREWRQQNNEVCLLIGGPEGLSAACLQRAHQRWSLSALTLPHPLVRIIIAEQIYRAWSILNGHPYHRA